MPYFVFDKIVIGPLKIYTWGLFVGFGFCAGYFWLFWQAGKKKIDQIKIIWLSFSVFVGALLGSRIFFLLQSPRRLLSNLSLLWNFDGGLMFFGGLIGGITASWLYLKLNRLNFKEVADLAAPAIALAIGIGRIGCFLINDHLGKITNLPWGILWPDGFRRQPVALYESLAGFILFAAILLLRNKIKKPGEIFLFFLAGYSFLRFFLDFLRESQGPLADPRLGGLSISQWLAFSIFLFSFFHGMKGKRFLEGKY